MPSRRMEPCFGIVPASIYPMLSGLMKLPNPTGIFKQQTVKQKEMVLQVSESLLGVKHIFTGLEHYIAGLVF